LQNPPFGSLAKLQESFFLSVFLRYLKLSIEGVSKDDFLGFIRGYLVLGDVC
jgi:hypothetical protein